MEQQVHEYGVTQNIIETACRHASASCNAAAAGNESADGASGIDGGNFTVKKIALVIGESSGIVGESVRLYFDLMAAGTACEKAVLEIETVKPMLKCRTCGKYFLRKPFSFECECGGEGEPTEIGREFYIKHIEVERQKWSQKQ